MEREVIFYHVHQYIILSFIVISTTFSNHHIYFLFQLPRVEPCNSHRNRTIPVYERILCWLLILLGVVGGVCATYTAIDNVVSSNFESPCYVTNGLWGQ